MFGALFACMGSRKSMHQDGKALKSKDYMAYITDSKNGLVVSCPDSFYIFNVTYMSPEVLAIKNIGIDSVNNINFQKQREVFENQTSFMIEIISKNNTSITSDMFYYYSYQIQNDVLLKSGNTLYKCISSQYVHSYAMSLPSRLFLDFDAVQLEDDLLLEIKNNSTSKRSFAWVFKKSDLERIPRLKI